MSRLHILASPLLGGSFFQFMFNGPLTSFLLFITSMIATLLLVPPVKKLAHAAGVIDEPCERKVHTKTVPRLGGLAMFFGCMVTFLIFLTGFEQYRGIFLGMVIIVIVGIIDDSLGLEPKLKFLGQVVAALAAMVMSDVNIDFLGGVLGSHYSLGFLSWPLTILWIVGITNAINLSDGLDGLAGGISLIAFTSFGILAYQRGDMQIFTLCLVFVGSILGFLRYNTHPAEIFMGDSGSLFLGYCLATLSIAGNFKSVTAVTLITPVLVLLVPIADTLWAIIRRIREGRSPFSADKLHFHHKLLNTGMDHSKTVSVIYGISVALSIGAVALANSSSFKFMLVPLIIAGVLLFTFQTLGVVDLARWTRKLNPDWFPFHLRSFMIRSSLRLIQLGTAMYLVTFLVGLSRAPISAVFVALTIIALVIYLAMGKSQNGQTYLIFSFFFLAAAMVLVIDYIPDRGDLMTTSLIVLESCGFILVAGGIAGKIIFKKTSELFLSTPLEFFIFLVLVSITMIPEEIRGDYNLVQNTLRTFFLFLAFKIIVLNFNSAEESSALPVAS